MSLSPTVSRNAGALPRGSLAEAGIDAAAVAGFLREVAEAGLELHTLMLHRNGVVALDACWWPYRTDALRVMHSAAKSWTACAVGLAIKAGHFALSDAVVDFFPDQVPQPLDPRVATMTVEDLLTMRTGHAEETSGSIWRGLAGSWIDEFFRIPLIHPPGETYVYTSAASYMLGAILARTTGETLHGYLKPRLFEPMGITGETWDVGPDGINPGGNGLTCTTEDLLKLGVLHAQGGVWNGRQLLPRAWVETATRIHAGGEYGYHWVTRANGEYAALGVFVQMCLVFPQQGATLAVTSAIDGSDKLLPVIDRWFPGAFGEPRDAGPADAALQDILAAGQRPRPLAKTTRARIGEGVYRMEPNAAGVSTVRLAFEADRCRFALTDAEGEHLIDCGLADWIEGRSDMPGRELHHGYALKDARVIAAAEWRDEATLDLTWIFAGTAFRDTVTCRFDDDRLTVERRVNINSGLREWPVLTGRLQT